MSPRPIDRDDLVEFAEVMVTGGRPATGGPRQMTLMDALRSLETSHPLRVIRLNRDLRWLIRQCHKRGWELV